MKEPGRLHKGGGIILGRISTDGDGDKHYSVNGDQWEQQGIVCNWRQSELGGAEDEG